MPTLWGDFHVGGIPRDGATVQLWSAGAFTSAPEKDDDIPSGSPIATATTGPAHGANGAYRFESVASGAYYASISWNGGVVYQYHLVQDGTGLGFVLAQDYANLQLAINATADGGTLYIPSGTYLIDNSATYAWTHLNAGAKHGLVVTNKKINIRGERGTVIRASASGVALLTLYTSSGAAVASRSSFGEVCNIQFSNTSGFSGCRGLVLDKAYRNVVSRCTFGLSDDSGGFDVGCELINSWIVNIDNCYGYRNTVAICATGSYTPVGSANGPSHGLTIRGGEYQSNGGGILLQDCERVTIGPTTIEGNSLYGVSGYAILQTNIFGNYWEQAAGIPDVSLEGSWRQCTIHNVHYVKARNGSFLTLHGFWDYTDKRIDIDSTVASVLLVNPWHAVSNDNSDSRNDILTHYEAGRLRIIGAGYNSSNLALPHDSVGVNLILNPFFTDSAAGWTLANMAADTTTVPYGHLTSVATNSVTPAVVCTTTRAIQGATSTELRSKPVTVSFWVKVPDSTWTAQCQLLCGDSSPLVTLPIGVKDGNWHHVSFPFQITSGSTNVQWRVRFVVGSSASGVAYCAGPTITLGEIPLRAAINPLQQPKVYLEPPVNVKAVTLLTTSGQIDPAASRAQLIGGSGGSIAVTTGQAFFSAATNWQDGQRVTLIGTHDTNTVVFTDGGNTKLKLRTSPLTVAKGTAITLMYSSTNALWSEV